MSFRSFFSIGDNKKVKMNSNGLPDIISINGTDTSIGITQDNALQFAIFVSIYRILSGDIARQNLKLSDENGEQVNVDRFLTIWNKYPNQINNPSQLRRKLVLDLLTDGNAYLQIVKNQQGSITQLRYLDTDDFLSAEQIDMNTIEYKFVNEINGTKIEPSELDLTQNDLLHFKFFDNDDICSDSPLLSIQDDIRAIQQIYNRMDKDVSRQLQQNYVLYLNQNLFNDSEITKQITDSFQKKFLGSQSQESVIPLKKDDMELKPLDRSELSSVDYQNQLTPHWQNIATVFGIPLSRLSNVEDIHSNSDQTDRPYRNGTLPSILDIFASEITFKIRPRGVYMYEEVKYTASDISNLTKSGVIDSQQGQLMLGIDNPHPVSNQTTGGDTNEE